MYRPLALLFSMLVLAGCQEGTPKNPRQSTQDSGNPKGVAEAKDGVKKDGVKKDGVTAKGGDSSAKDGAPVAKSGEEKQLVAELGSDYGLIRISQSLKDRLAKNTKLKAKAKDFADPLFVGAGLTDLADGRSTEKAQAVAGLMDSEVVPELRQSLDEYVKPDVRDALLRKIEAARAKK